MKRFILILLALAALLWAMHEKPVSTPTTPPEPVLAPTPENSPVPEEANAEEPPINAEEAPQEPTDQEKIEKLQEAIKGYRREMRDFTPYRGPDGGIPEWAEREQKEFIQWKQGEIDEAEAEIKKLSRNAPLQ